MRRAEQRALRRARANARVISPIDRPVRDPLIPSAPPARARRWATLLIAGAGLHAALIGGLLLSGALAEEAEAPVEEPTEVAVLEPEPEPKRETPPPEPEPEPLPVEAGEPLNTPATPAAPAPQIGISADSTVEGGEGPAFQTGDSLAGAMASGGLAREILHRDGKQTMSPEEMVMTSETVDTQPAPLASNRQPAAPAKARQKGLSGFVVVRMMIGKDGAVQEAKILQASPPGIFEDKVLEVVPTWKFSPATYKGQPVVMRVDQTIRFEIG